MCSNISFCSCASFFIIVIWLQIMLLYFSAYYNCFFFCGFLLLKIKQNQLFSVFNFSNYNIMNIAVLFISNSIKNVFKYCKGSFLLSFIKLIITLGIVYDIKYHDIMQYSHSFNMYEEYLSLFLFYTLFVVKLTQLVVYSLLFK